MARPRTFDRSRALRKAMRLFWRKGYSATSVHDLGAELGLKPGSLYNAFQDKHSLFLEALDCYQADEGGPSCQLLEGPSGTRAQIRQIFEAVVELDLADPERKGCLMVNTAVELAPHDPVVRERVAAAREQMLRAVRIAVVRGQQAGEIGAHHDPDALAAFLVNTLHGLRLTAKMTADRAALMAIVDVTMRALD
ncbi:MAG: TetR/AcrR family transcriptional regulator [Roseiflexaceae bacterium]